MADEIAVPAVKGTVGIRDDMVIHVQTAADGAELKFPDGQKFRRVAGVWIRAEE